MADRIQLKRSDVPGRVPVSADLSAGELAVNTADGKLFVKLADDSVVQVGGGGSPLAAEYDSGRQTVTLGGSTTLTHGLGVPPKTIAVFMYAYSSDVGYTTGDYVPLSPADGTNGGSINSGLVVSATATELYLRLPSAIELPNKNTGVRAAIQSGRWRWRVRAWA